MAKIGVRKGWFYFFTVMLILISFICEVKILLRDFGALEASETLSHIIWMCFRVMDHLAYFFYLLWFISIVCLLRYMDMSSNRIIKVGFVIVTVVMLLLCIAEESVALTDEFMAVAGNRNNNEAYHLFRRILWFLLSPGFRILWLIAIFILSVILFVKNKRKLEIFFAIISALLILVCLINDGLNFFDIIDVIPYPSAIYDDIRMCWDILEHFIFVLPIPWFICSMNIVSNNLQTSKWIIAH